MIPKAKVKEIVSKHSTLEKDLLNGLKATFSSFLFKKLRSTNICYTGKYIYKKSNKHKTKKWG